MDKTTTERWTRLQEFFASDSWKDLKAEIEFCQNNADNTLKSPSCGSRDYYAGKCNAFAEVLSLSFKISIKQKE